MTTPQNMEKESWRDEVVKKYEEDADVSSSKSFVALLRALDTAHSLGEKAMLEKVVEVVNEHIVDLCMKDSPAAYGNATLRNVLNDLQALTPTT